MTTLGGANPLPGSTVVSSSVLLLATGVIKKLGIPHPASPTNVKTTSQPTTFKYGIIELKNQTGDNLFAPRKFYEGAKIVTMAYRVGKDEFAELVELALEQLPPQFGQFLEEVPIEIMDRPSPAQRQSVNLRSDQLLLGLYQGRPRTRRSIEDSGTFPDVIYIFQDSIQAVAPDREGLIEQVRKTVLHEIGHHFGMSESDLEKLGYG